MPNTDLIQRLDQLPEQYRLYVLSPMPQVIATSFGEFHKLDEKKTLALENGLTLYLLFFLTTADFVEFIVAECGLDEKTATTLVSGIDAALSDDIRKTHEEIGAMAFNDEASTPSLSPSLAPEPATPSLSVQADLAEIEKTLHQLSPVRTMATDGKQIGYSSTTEDTYTSSQSAIINETR